MSTRCIVRVKGNFAGSVDIYHHHDGYPAGVGVALHNALTPLFEEKKEKKKRNSYISIEFGRVIKSILEIDNEYELTECTHYDIEYMYIVDLKKSKISCYEGYYNKYNIFVIKQRYALEVINGERVA